MVHLLWGPLGDGPDPWSPPLLLNLHVWRISSWCYLLFSVFNCISSHQAYYLVTSFEIIYVVHLHKNAWAQVVIQDSICGLYVRAHPSFCPSKPFILWPPIEQLWYSHWGILYALAMMVGLTISTVWMSRLGPCAIERPNKLCRLSRNVDCDLSGSAGLGPWIRTDPFGLILD